MPPMEGRHQESHKNSSQRKVILIVLHQGWEVESPNIDYVGLPTGPPTLMGSTLDNFVLAIPPQPPDTWPDFLGWHLTGCPLMDVTGYYWDSDDTLAPNS